MKYYVVADVHGYYDLLVESLKESGFYEDKNPHKLIIIGDFFDRGNQALEMQKFLVDEIEKDQVILVKGNHEDLVEELVYNFNKYRFTVEESHHFRNSTVDTCSQLTNMSLGELKRNSDEFVKKMLKTDYFTKIIPSCVDYFETKNYIFTHGYIPCFAVGYGEGNDFKYNPNWRKASKSEWIYARWYNGMKVNHLGVKENKTIVVGHWHTSFGHHYFECKGDEFGVNADFSPYYADGLIAIDGCVPRSSHINCIVIEDEDL